MKKIILVAFSALAALFVSCDMDMYPYTGIVEDQYNQNIDDAINMSVSIYTPTKGMFGGFRWDVEEIRGGMFNAKADFGNYYGLFYAWITQANDSDVEALWYADYSIIASMNYIVGSYEKLLASGKITDKAEQELLSNYIAEARMTRAIAYWDLVTKFCVAYDEATANDVYGLPIQLEYAPTSDSSKYPGRSSLEETYQVILEDLEAASALTTPGAKNSVYWTIDAVNAMRARVFLNMKKYEDAADIAINLINTGTYRLVESAGEMNNMWFADTSDENIFVVAASLNDAPTSTGSYYIYDNNARDGSTPNSQYLPSQTLIDLYGATAEERAKDLRYAAYFQTRPIEVSGMDPKNMEIFWKFSGNPTLRTGAQLNYTSAGKPFRIAEQYLIAAEACAHIDGRVATGVKYLNDLRRSRIADYTDLSIAGSNELLKAVKDEWTREFVGEGFRMINMKRWGDKIVRGVSQDSARTRPGDNYDGLQKDITDSRCILPIPKTELDANPQIKGQQNDMY